MYLVHCCQVSRSWCFRFCRRYAALLQTLPSPDTPLPSALELQVVEYRQRLHDVLSSRGVTLESIIALDEVPLHFLSKGEWSNQEKYTVFFQCNPFPHEMRCFYNINKEIYWFTMQSIYYYILQ
jgi:hypothetical protein